MTETAKTTIGRRQLLHAFGASVAATAASPIVTKAKADTESAGEKGKSRYQESEHVKTFYRVNHYPR